MPLVVFETEPVTRDPWIDVKMKVKHLLFRTFTVSDEHIDAIARQPGCAECSGDTVTNLEAVTGKVFRKIAEIRQMGARNDQRMAFVHGFNRHQGNAEFIGVDFADRIGAVENLAENAILLRLLCPPIDAVSAGFRSWTAHGS